MKGLIQEIALPRLEPDASPMTLPEILEAAKEFLSRYVVFSNEAQAIVVALWVAHTWVIEAFDYTPYLHISPRSSDVGSLACLTA